MSADDLRIIASAASLAMDAFSVSICVGLCHNGLSPRQGFSLSGAFGAFQFAMPLAGAWISSRLTGFFDGFTPWVSAALILWVALSMIKEARGGIGKTQSCMLISFKNIVVLAFATSLDALAVGFSMSITGTAAPKLAIAAGLITFLLSLLGAMSGGKIGEKTGDRAEYFGGAVLSLIALKIVADAVLG